MPITLLYCIKESCVSVTAFVKPLELNKDSPMASQRFLHVYIDFKTKKEIS